MRRTITLSLITIIVLWLGAFCFACNGNGTQTNSAAGASEMETILTNKRIVAGWAPYPPYAQVNLQTKQPEGFYIELFNRMAKEAGLEITWVETTWSTMIADMKTGRFQVMAAPVFRTIPRAEEVAFTRSIDYFGLSAVVPIGEQRFKEPSDFNRADITIVVTQGEVGHEFAIRNLPAAKLVIHKAGDISLALVDVIEGRANVGICDSWTAKLFAREHSDKVRDLFGDKPFNRVGAGWFVRHGDPELLLFLNTSIDWLDSSGTIADVAKKYELASTLK